MYEGLVLLQLSSMPAHPTATDVFPQCGAAGAADKAGTALPPPLSYFYHHYHTSHKPATLCLYGG